MGHIPLVFWRTSDVWRTSSTCNYFRHTSYWSGYTFPVSMVPVIFSLSCCCFIFFLNTLTCGSIKWTPYVAFTGSFLNIVFGQYFRWGVKKTATKKFGMSLTAPVFAWQYCPWCHVCFVKNERLECEIMVSLLYYSEFYWHYTYTL